MGLCSMTTVNGCRSLDLSANAASGLECTSRPSKLPTLQFHPGSLPSQVSFWLACCPCNSTSCGPEQTKKAPWTCMAPFP